MIYHNRYRLANVCTTYFHYKLDIYLTTWIRRIHEDFSFDNGYSIRFG